VTRDELIDELKKAPSNGEVEIFAMFTEDVVCGSDTCNHEFDIEVERWLRISSIRTIPAITIVVEI